MTIKIEINVKSSYVGTITGKNYDEAVFAYADEYLKRNNCKPISLSLPL